MEFEERCMIHMNDEQRAAMFLEETGYIIVDEANDAYPNFKDLTLASGATSTLMKKLLPNIESSLKNKGEGEIEYCQLPTAEHVIYNPDIYPTGVTKLPKK